MIRVLIWNEYRHEKCQPEVAKIYPQGMHAAIGEYLMQDEDIIVKLACLDDPEQGLSEERSRKPTCSSGGVTWRMTR